MIIKENPCSKCCSYYDGNVCECSELRAYNHYRQGRLDAIDECIETLYEVTPNTVEQKLDNKFIEALKKLKERIHE